MRAGWNLRAGFLTAAALTAPTAFGCPHRHKTKVTSEEHIS
ncbi:hypothetical protein [Halapricum salinum]|nr:hypothetical protein [Halapricum salinum]